MEKYTDAHSPSIIVPVPGLIFGPVLEGIHDVVELKCILRTMFLLHRNRTMNGVIKLDDVLEDVIVSKSLHGNNKGEQRAIVERAVDVAVAYGILLKKSFQMVESDEVWLFLNNLANRKLIDRTQKELQLTQPFSVVAVTENSSSKINIFQLYEELIGIITPMIAERLKELEQEYSVSSIEEAFRVAAMHDKHRLSYIEGILRSWKEGDRKNGSRGRRAEKVSIMEIFRRSRE
ncbi:DnaD domain protein [SAR202 cluster bacterium AD-802-E10_MRT_200m]|nr:DnaD domain protein [SAR202 cluster bacterium AD-802-E10_MRT_200m]